jgi:CRP-like cAMP-binding protein
MPDVQLLIAALSRLPMFAVVGRETLSELAHQARLSHFERDAVIFRQGDACERVYVLQAGKVKIVYQEEDGRETILEIIQPGEPFGGATLFFPSHPATAIVLEPAQVVSIAGDDYRAFIQRYPPVAMRVIGALGARLASLMAANIAAGRRVDQRLARVLLKLADRCGEVHDGGVLIPIPLSRQDLADLSGTTLETAIRVMSRFRSDNLVHTERGGLIILTDRERLHEVAFGPGAVQTLER